jgi:hypothetical protein
MPAPGDAQLTIGVPVVLLRANYRRVRPLTLRHPAHRIRHDGCGGRAGKAELLTGIAGVSSQPMRRIVLLGLRN